MKKTQNFDYEIRDALGIHARPAGALVKKAKAFESKITISKNGKAADATRLLAVMGLGIQCGDRVYVTVQGADEREAADTLLQFFSENL